MYGRRASDREKVKVPVKAFCILGDERVFEQRSAAMFTGVMRNAYLKGAYVPYRVDFHQLGNAIKALNVLNMAGANVASPFKEAAIPWMDELSEAAQIIGSINTIIITGDQRKGYNTNAIGITHALKSVDFKPADKPAVVIGTGGAARTVAFVLNWLKAKPVYVVGRNHKKTVHITEKLGGEAVDLNDLSRVAKDAKIIVNATSVSTKEEGADFANQIAGLAPDDCELVFDLNYDRPKNCFQGLADKGEIQFMDGLTALAHQGSQTLALWTGTTIDPKEFLKALSQT